MAAMKIISEASYLFLKLAYQLKQANNFKSLPLKFINVFKTFINTNINMEDVLIWYKKYEDVFNTISNRGDKLTNLNWDLKDDDDDSKPVHLEAGEIQINTYYYRMQTYRGVPDFLKIHDSYFLKGVGNIQDLYLYRVSYVGSVTEYNLDISHN